MATNTFNAFYLGNFADIDPDESNFVAENAAILSNRTFGGTGDPLYNRIEPLTTNDADNDGIVRTNSAGQTGEGITYKGTTSTFDSAATYNVTITYIDGTTATAVVAVMQDVAGRTFLVPFETGNAYNTALSAKPIQSVSFGSVNTNNYYGASINQEKNAFSNSHVDGTSGNDTIGTSYRDADGTTMNAYGGGNDTVYAGTGNDSVYAGTGADSVYGGTGNDRLYGGDGNDTLYGDDGSDTLYGDAGADALYGGLGNDLIFGNSGTDTIYGGDSNDTIDGGDNSDTVYGGDGDDYITDTGGTLSDDTIYGGAGNDTIYAGTREDLVYGGTGQDLIYGGEGNDTLYGEDGNDTVYGDDGNDSINTGSGDDRIFGGAGNDTIIGGDGNDTFVGGAGADSMDGGFGSDTVDYSASGAAVNIVLNVSASGGDAAGDILAGMDDLIGSEFGDNLTGYDGVHDGRTTSNIIDGGGGNDTIFGLGGNDLLYGGTGNDLIFGGWGDDTLFGGAGNDTLDGGDGNDFMYGGDGDDRIIAGTWNNQLFGGAGNDTFVAENGFGNNTITGGETSDTLGDMLDASGLTTAATLTFTGNEAGTLTNGGSFVTFTEIERFTLGSGNDTVNASSTTTGVNIVTGAGADSITGGSGADSLYGGTGNDFISGGAGNDSLMGGDGNDTLTGGAGNDTLDGGSGDDRAVFSGAVEQYSFSYGTGGALIVTDSVTGRDGTDTLSNVEYLEFNGKVYRLVQGDNGSNTTLQGPEGEPALIIAHDGNDWGGGHATSDAIFGGAGDDTLDGGDGNDTLVGDDGNDLLRGDGDDDALYGGAGQDTLQGGTGNDAMFGGNGNDLLQGGAGNDSLDGGTGNDTLQGGAGSDTLTGGDGADLFGFERAGGADRITDFDRTLVDGKTLDQLDVSDLRTQGGDPVKWRDVTVSDDGNGNAVLTFPEGETIVLEGVSPEQASGKQNMARMGVPCYAPGTSIDTPDGPRPVEQLCVGDLVTTVDHGPQAIRWVRSVSYALHNVIADARPVLIKAGALGRNLPVQDLIVSPQHRILIGGFGQLQQVFPSQGFAPAKSLTVLPGIRHMNGKKEITWVHFACDRHEVVIANGCLSESLLLGPMVLDALDTDQRAILAALFGSPSANGTALNGPPARDCLTVGAVKSQIAKHEKEKKGLLAKDIQKWDEDLSRHNDPAPQPFGAVHNLQDVAKRRVA